MLLFPFVMWLLKNRKRHTWWLPHFTFLLVSSAFTLVTGERKEDPAARVDCRSKRVGVRLMGSPWAKADLWESPTLLRNGLIPVSPPRSSLVGAILGVVWPGWKDSGGSKGVAAGGSQSTSSQPADSLEGYGSTVSSSLLRNQSLSW